MLIIRRPQTEPYFNIAAEEYFLRDFKENIFMLWQNEPSIIIGKHQNTLAEINLNYITKHQIPVIRRITGGGTVFHDLGNINFTFIKNIINEDLVDFKRFTYPIIEVLKSLGVQAKHEGKNDIRINGLKCSGNAEHVFKSRVLHHGTLLFSSDLNNLGETLKSKEGNFISKAVKSNRSDVTNISDHLKQPLRIEQFIELVNNYLVANYPDTHYYELREQDMDAINTLANEKYKTWEWNFGYSPAYQYKNKVNDLACTLEIKNGIIIEASIIDSKTMDNFKSLEKEIVGIKHQKKELNEFLFNKYSLENINNAKMLALLFAV
ncbi:MAG: lipoate--protein ligase [Bacteroidetes bacterium]|nr:lipoate--protein ligase [Bacteroidota bacterium]